MEISTSSEIAEVFSFALSCRLSGAIDSSELVALADYMIEQASADIPPFVFDLSMWSNTNVKTLLEIFGKALPPSNLTYDENAILTYLSEKRALEEFQSPIKVDRTFNKNFNKISPRTKKQFFTKFEKTFPFISLDEAIST